VFLDVRKREGSYKELEFVVKDLEEKKQNAEKTLIFVKSINKTTEILLWMRENLSDYGRVYLSDGSHEYNVEMYTGSTSSTSKSRIAEDFQAAGSTTKVLIATIAYGMGVNVKGLKQVVVYDIPKYPTTLMQMIGRCSRDQESGRCILVTPVVPTIGTMGFEIAGTCPRRYLLDKLCGGPLSPVVEAPVENCIGKSCSRCMCCSVCSQLCKSVE
jgi:superfamily II DNA helicase RecQ